MTFGVSSRLAGSIAALALSACGSSAVPRAENAKAIAAVSAAEASGAAQVPRAALHLKMAQDAMDRAEGQIEEGEDEAARLTLERASADATLAQSLTTEQKVRNEADQAAKRVEQLRLRTTTF